MSAFMCSHDFFLALAHTLATVRLPDSPDAIACRIRPARTVWPVNGYDTRDAYKLACDIVRDWRASNVRAVRARYGNNSADMLRDIACRLTANRGPALTLVELYKQSQCLNYQCSETVPKAEERKHRRTLREIELLHSLVLPAIVHDLAEYKDTGWGGIRASYPAHAL